MRYVVLDTETTGLDPDDGHKIIEIGCIEINNRKVTDNSFHKYINPLREIDIEASKVPSHWHAWLHKTIDAPPLNYSHKYTWQIDHEQNMTGTDNAYYPSSHPLSKSYKADAIKKEYESWNP